MSDAKETPESIAAAFVRGVCRERAVRKQEGHVVAAVVEIAEGLAAYAQNMSDEGLAEFAAAVESAKRHQEAAEAWKLVVEKCDEALAVLTLPASP